MPYEPPKNPGMKEAYILQQADHKIYAMAWLTPWFIGELNLLLNTELFIMHLNRIFVPKPHRGRGYGHSLLNRICCDADRLGVVLDLSVEPDFEWDRDWIHSMYEHAGFKDELEIGGMVRWPKIKTASTERLHRQGETVS